MCDDRTIEWATPSGTAEIWRQCCGFKETARVVGQAAVTHVVMESTGSYWKPIFNVLEDSVKV
jgi:transposase